MYHDKKVPNKITVRALVKIFRDTKMFKRTDTSGVEQLRAGMLHDAKDTLARMSWESYRRLSLKTGKSVTYFALLFKWNILYMWRKSV
jgi:hypothetical protein